MAKLADHDLLRAASRALDELSNRDRDTLEQAILDNKTIEEIARASLISIERAAFWMDGARTQFREKLRLQLEQLGGEELAPTEVHDVLAAALQRIRSAIPGVAPETEPLVRCPKCNAGFRDPSGQYAAYVKLATQGQVGLMIGCTACSLLFVPVPQPEKRSKA